MARHDVRNAIRSLLASADPPEDTLTDLGGLAGPANMGDATWIGQCLAVPLDWPLAWLTCFMSFRHPQKFPERETWMEDFYAVEHPLFGWSPAVVQERVRCHSPTKTMGDEFAQQFADFVQASPKETPSEKRCLFVISALILVPRSMSMLHFFAARVSAPLGRHTIMELYNYFLDKKLLHPGLEPTRKRQAHTTEQKLLSIGQLLDTFLAPWLLDESCWDRHLDLEATKFILSVDGMPWLKGPLQQVHFCDYVIHAGLMAETLEASQAARNSALFLELSGRSCFGEIAKEIERYVHFPISWRDVSSSSCMTIRLMQCYLSGSTNGKARVEEYRPAQTGFRKELEALLATHVMPNRLAMAKAIVYEGCRYLTAGMFCAQCKLTMSSDARRQAIQQADRYSRKQIIYAKVHPSRVGHLLQELGGQVATGDARLSRKRPKKTEAHCSLYRVGAMTRVAASVENKRARIDK